MAVYVDTSAWIALKEPRDRNHPGAERELGRLLGEGRTLVTGWHTLVEYGDGLARHYSQKEAAESITKLIASQRVRLEDSEPHLAGALELFRSRVAWGVDLSDCLSFAMMRALRLEEAFTYDGDFAKAGFRIVG